MGLILDKKIRGDGKIRLGNGLIDRRVRPVFCPSKHAARVTQSILLVEVV
jgi:hypothetical protein